MIQCTAPSQIEWRIKTMNTLQKRMEQLATKFALGETMCIALSEWFETGHVQLQNYPNRYHPAI